MNRPVELSDKVFDFTSNPTLGFSLTVDIAAIGSYTYECFQEAGSTQPFWIDNAGNKYSSPKFLISKSLIRKISGTGLVYDLISTPLGNDSGRYQYLIFQKAKAVIQDGGNSNAFIISGSQINASQNETRSFDTSLTVGADISKTLIVEVTDTNNNYIPATVNTDYQVITGGLLPNVTNNFSLKFLKANVNYRLTLNVNGYTSNNNPYNIEVGLGTGRSLINENKDSISFIVSTYSSVSPIDYTITFPKILCVLTPQYTVKLSPLTTYQNSNITINGSLDLTNSSWVETNTQTHVSTSKTLTLDQWIAEINARYKIILSIINKANNSTVLTDYQGLGPFTVILPQGDYLAQFNYVPL